MRGKKEDRKKPHILIVSGKASGWLEDVSSIEE
jgi:hypothetical protein